MPKIGDTIGGKKLGYKSTNRFIWSACTDCGREKWVQLYKGKPKNLKCHSCVAKYIQQGKNNNHWKGGRRKDGYGYILIWIDSVSPFFAMKCHENYVLEHRLIMAQHLRRCLESWEIIHHKGIKYTMDSIENRQDNRIENLELCNSNGEHLGLHKEWRRKVRGD